MLARVLIFFKAKEVNKYVREWTNPDSRFENVRLKRMRMQTRKFIGSNTKIKYEIFSLYSVLGRRTLTFISKWQIDMWGSIFNQILKIVGLCLPFTFYFFSTKNCIIQVSSVRFFQFFFSSVRWNKNRKSGANSPYAQYYNLPNPIFAGQEIGVWDK